MGRVGAQVAVSAAVSSVVEDLASATSPKQMVGNSLAAARHIVERTATSLGQTVQLADLSCTLLVAVAGSFGMATAQIGDGAIVADFEDGAGLVNLTPPSSAEYLNVTDFLTSNRFPDASVLTHRHEYPSRIAAMSDGVEHLAITRATGDPSPGFFDPLFARLDRGQISRAQVETLFRSNSVTAKTDDDLTLVLASRRQQSSESSDN